MILSLISNLKNPSWKPSSRPKLTIGILSFELTNALSITIHLHHSLSDSEISKLKAEVFSSPGVKNLVSDDETFLFELALAEKLDDLNKVASVMSRLGKKCAEPILQGFEHVYGDIVNGVIAVRELGVLVEDMDIVVKKMEKYVNATSILYSEMKVLNELEEAAKEFQQNRNEENRGALKQKFILLRQNVKHLKKISLWSQTYDKIIELLARIICTIFATISVVFGAVSNAGFGLKSRLTVNPPHSTVGGSALALHYADIIVVIEKLLRHPHLIGEEARDDLNQMLPKSLRLLLRSNLKSYVKNLAINNASLADDWKETLDRTLKWFAPLAHNMIRWKNDHNFKQHQIVSRSNVLLPQTLQFADRRKTEAAICELLVGLNYICRYEEQKNALLDCGSSFDLEDWIQWQIIGKILTIFCT